MATQGGEQEAKDTGEDAEDCIAAQKQRIGRRIARQANTQARSKSAPPRFGRRYPPVLEAAAPQKKSYQYKIPGGTNKGAVA